jgi:hypothetical protein
MVTSWEFLGVIIDQYLNFHTHIGYVLDKAQKKFYSQLQLKRFGVSCDKLVLFYVANIRSILTYCIPAFFPMLTDIQLKSLERFQKLCTRVILPHIEDYSERLSALAIPELRLSVNHFVRIILSR